MKKEEMWKMLHQVFTGKENETHSIISKYESVGNPEKGLQKAQEYLKSARRGQESCRSDWSYWAYEGDITLATILVAIFKKLMEDTDYEFPDIPGVQGKMLMDKVDDLKGWAEAL